MCPNPPAPAMRPVPARARILVVEDDEDAALFLMHVLEKRGPFQVTHTPDPAAALAMTAAAAEPWDLVITDLELPSMSGRELTGALRRLDPLLPVVLVTACEAATRGPASADAILIKPLRVDQLLATVNALISAMRVADLPTAAEVLAHPARGVSARRRNVERRKSPLLPPGFRGHRETMTPWNWVQRWPAYRQLASNDRLGLGAAAKSAKTERITPRTKTADKIVKSVCPYCAVGCAQNVYVRDGKVIQIEGDPDSPVSRGRLCPKGSASLQLTTGSARQYEVLYRRPHGTDWERLDLDIAMDMIADRVIDARRNGWQWEEQGHRTRRTLGFAGLGGATLDNEENYLIKKLFTALGAIQIENQARI